MKRALGLVVLILMLGGAVAVPAQSPFFYLAPQEISFGTVTVGQTATRTVRAYRGADDGTVVTATSDNPAFSVTPMSQVVGTDGDTFTVRFHPLASGLQSGIITFTEGGSQPRVLGELPVNGTGFAPFTVNPTSLTFEQTLVGASLSKTFRIIVGSQVEAIDLSVQSSHPDVFLPSPASFSAVSGGQSRVVTVAFSPDTAGVLRGAIRITGGGAVVSVEVEGEGSAFLLSPAQLDLGGALVGCSTSRPFTVTTGGLFDFQIVPVTQGLPFSAEPATFSASEPTEVTALFAPVAAGPAQGALRVFARLGGMIVQQQDLAVAGIGTEPVASPAAIDFGETPVGVAASGSFVIMPNPPAAFQGIYSASSDNPAFRVVSTNTSGRVNIDFSPVAEGPASGIITVEVATQSDRECAATVQVPVEGIGGQALLTLTPETIDFGMQPVGQASSPREVVVSNQSNRAFSGTVTSNSPAFRVNPAVQGAVAQTTVNVPAGGSVRVPIVFEPAAVGVVDGQVTFDLSGAPIASGDIPPVVVRTVTVSGEGAAANLSFVVVQAGTPAPVSPGGVVDFGPTGVGSANSVEFEVRNEGSTPAPVDLISASDQPIFDVQGPALPTTIAPGATLTLTLSFQPAALSSYSGALAVGSSVFTLEGRGVLGGAEITGIGDTLAAGGQAAVGVRLSGPAAQDLSGTLTMVYTPAGTLPADPSAQFVTGGMSVPFTVPAGGEVAAFSGADSIGFQAGTVAASFEFAASLESGEVDVTPTPSPTRTATVAAGPPTISSATVEAVTASGFTVVVQGFSPTREITQATFTFTGRSGVQVQPGSVTPAGIGAAFQSWYQSATSAPFGSMFTLTMPFTISGETNGIASVAVTVANAQGTSQPSSANLP